VSSKDFGAKLPLRTLSLSAEAINDCGPTPGYRRNQAVRMHIPRVVAAGWYSERSRTVVILI